MASGKSIIRNTAFLSGAFVGQKILSFIYFTLIARFVGAVDTGAYVFALSYSTIFSVFVDFGLAPLIQREIARKPDRTKSIVNHTLRIKLFYALGAIGAGLILIHFLVDDPLLLRMVYIAMALMAVDSFNLTVWGAFRGHHKLQYESLAVVGSQVIVLLIGLLGLKAGLSLEILIIALLVGSVTTAVYSAVLCRSRLKFWPFPKKAPDIGSEFVKESIPFGFAGAFTRVFSSIDSVLLRQMVGQAAVGFYAVPNKIVFAAQFIPSAFAASIYPAMSHYYKENKEKMVHIFEQAVLFLLILSIPMAVGVFVLAPLIIIELYTSSFAPSITAMYVLVWGIIFGFVEFPLGSLLSAIGQQRKNMITRGVVMTVNIILNLVLIPLYSFVGAAIAALISYAVLAGLGIFWVRKFVKVDWSLLIGAFFKIVAAAFLMGVLVFVLLDYLHFTLLILLGMVVYAMLVISFKVIDLDQVRFLLKSFRKA